MTETFPEKIPPAFQDLISQGKREIERQVRKSSEEERVRPEELADPIGDNHYSTVKGITHRYGGRVLLKPIMRCAVHCRFCFRRESVNASPSDLSPEELSQALAYIEAHKEIEEVILTGGDPLMLTNEKLLGILKSLDAIDHVRVLRIHSRVPVALPTRVDAELASVLSGLSKVVWLVVHTNSAAELTDAARAGLATLRRRGVPLLSQSVLLRGVNDSSDALAALFSTLVSLGVKPYYLHYPDLVRGTSHFRVPLERALEIVQSLSEKISGTALPKLCIDLPRGLGKVFPASSPWARNPEGHWLFTSPLSGEQVEIHYSEPS